VFLDNKFLMKFFNIKCYKSLRAVKSTDILLDKLKRLTHTCDFGLKLHNMCKKMFYDYHLP